MELRSKAAPEVPTIEVSSGAALNWCHSRCFANKATTAAALPIMLLDMLNRRGFQPVSLMSHR